ncbi:MAG: hypothetical protein IPJ85_01055 [Flavobacteriales bacterium]|nr:hypothetical protein [Flavobacteriales bacterium]
MRKLNKNRWALASLALLLLLATSGLTVSRMSCLISGHSVLSLGIAADCCPDDEHGEGVAFKATCCDLAKASAERVVLLPSSSADLIALPLADPVQIWAASTRECISVQWLNSRPPPLIGRERLALMRRFLI